MRSFGQSWLISSRKSLKSLSIGLSIMSSILSKQSRNRPWLLSSFLRLCLSKGSERLPLKKSFKYCMSLSSEHNENTISAFLTSVKFRICRICLRINFKSKWYELIPLHWIKRIPSENCFRSAAKCKAFRARLDFPMPRRPSRDNTWQPSLKKAFRTWVVSFSLNLYSSFTGISLTWFCSVSFFKVPLSV